MNMMNTHVKQQCQLLFYLERRSILIEMKNICEKYLKELNEKTIRKFPPLRYLLEIDVMDLIDMFPDLGNNLLKEPFKWQCMCNGILFACLQTINNSDEAVELAQVAVNLRFKSVPKLLVRPNQRYYAGLVSFYGQLLTFSKPVSYVYHTVWSCPEECEGNEVILHFIPKVPPKCYVCRSVLFENSGLRRCGDQVTATFKLNNRLLPKTLAIVDDMIPKLKLGAMYNIVAVAVKKSITAWSLEEVIPLPAPLTSPVPDDIEDLYKACKGVPWKFIYCLASSIGINVCPLNCFMHLKISLLLSLASIKANVQTGSSIVHVLVAGHETEYVGRLMEEGARLADRFVCLGTSNTSTSTALIASSGGICLMSLPLHIYNQKQTASVLASIETGEVTTETNKIKLQSAVWAQGKDFKKLNLLNVASIFGTVCRGDYGEYNDEIVDFVLKNAVEPSETGTEEVKTMKDVELYLDLVSGIEVSLDDRAELLLRSYFLAARKERPRGVTVGSMGALVAACVTSARLCRRLTATVDDAVLAIWLHVSGSPEPRFAPEEYLQTPADVKRLHKIMNDFKDWLEQFIGNNI